MGRGGAARRFLGAAAAAFLVTAAVVGCSEIQALRGPQVPAEAQAGAQYLARGEREKARQQFEAALKRHRGDVQACFAVIESCRNAGEYGMEAEFALRCADDTRESDVATRSQFIRAAGVAYAYLQDFDRALSLLKQAHKMNPKNAVIMNDLGYVLADAGRELDLALSLTTEAVRMAHESGRASNEAMAAFLDSLGWVHYRRGDLNAAIEHLARAAEMAPGMWEIHYHLAVACHKKGMDEEARVELLRARTAAPEKVAISEALQLVDQSLAAKKKRTAPSTERTLRLGAP